MEGAIGTLGRWICPSHCRRVSAPESLIHVSRWNDQKCPPLCPNVLRGYWDPSLVHRTTDENIQALLACELGSDPPSISLNLSFLTCGMGSCTHFIIPMGRLRGRRYMKHSGLTLAQSKHSVPRGHHSVGLTPVDPGFPFPPNCVSKWQGQGGPSKPSRLHSALIRSHCGTKSSI